jgi:arsenite methyltransferase
MTRDPNEIKDAVREAYRSAALRVRAGSCCGPSQACSPADTSSDFGAALYGEEDLGRVPDAARLASLGCGNPTAIAALRPGQRVLDLGSGGGLDVLLAAQRVGPSGFVWGLDMTDEMLDLARANQAAAGIGNAEFIKGDIEDIPLPDAAVDVVISNCVVNLAPDKAAVFREAHRVLRPGGRFAVSDVVATRRLSDKEQADLVGWAGCLAGALTAEEYTTGLTGAGFKGIEVTDTHPVAPGAVAALINATA